MRKAVWMILALIVPAMAIAADWPRYRGPNGSGVGDAVDLPVEFGQDENVAWKAQVPRGTSSPVVVGDSIFLTAFDGDERLVYALDAHSGRQLWRKSIMKRTDEGFHPSHGPATPTPTSDGKRLYVFFPDIGLTAFTLDGRESWTVEIGGFNSVQGIAVSPVVADDLVVLLVDQTLGSYLAAFRAETGEQAWRVDRPANFMGGYSTPGIYQPEEGPKQLIVAGASELTGYQLSTGEELWSAPGVTFAPATLPVIANGMVYTCEPYNTAPPPFSSMLEGLDKNKDNALDLDEFREMWGLRAFLDRMDGDYGDKDGRLTQAEWNKAFESANGQGGLVAVRLGGEGELGESAVAWRYNKSLPYLSSVLLYDGVLYSIRDGGILLAFDPISGEIVKQGRVREAMEDYWASPVAADGKIYLTSREGKVSVLKAGAEWEVLATNDLGARTQATPAIAHGSLYVRSGKTIYCFRRMKG